MKVDKQAKDGETLVQIHIVNVIIRSHFVDVSVGEFLGLVN